MNNTYDMYEDGDDDYPDTFKERPDTTMNWTDYPDFEELLSELKSLNEWEAVQYLKCDAESLRSFRYSGTLFECFKWSESAQGFAYWETIYLEMISMGLDVAHPSVSEKIWDT